MDPEFFERNRKDFEDLRDEADADTVNLRVQLSVLEPSIFDERIDELELVVAHSDTSGSGARLPNLLGLTKREAKLRTLELGIGWDPQGTGRVVRQTPPEGTPLDEIRVCKLVFGRYVENDDDW